MRKRAIDYIFLISGLVLFGFANAIAVKVKYLGLHPWEVLNVALFQKYGLTIGAWSVITGLLLMVVTWNVNKKYINIGTFANALLVGPFMDFFLWLDFLPNPTQTYTDYITLACAITIAGIAGGLYVAGGVGAGPRDGFMLAVSEKTKLSISRARIVVESVIMVVGYFLGGPIFVATFLYSLIQSPIFQVMLKFFKRVRESLIQKLQPEQVSS